MATFRQHDDAREAMQQAAREYLTQYILTGPVKELAEALEVTPREIYRYKAYLTGGPSQKRNPFATRRQLVKLAENAPAPSLTFHDGYITPQDNPKYRRHRKNIDPEEMPDDFLEQALLDPDEAWQTYFETYFEMPATADHVSISLQ